jgi:formylglycine-generating enzyme required for sulfatase activity
MVLVEGEYCENVQHKSLRYLDPPGRYHEFRCAEYEKPARCLSDERVSLRFCIDRDEFTRKSSTLPENHKSFSDAIATCRARGARVCQESEWNFACEGEEMRPYPYGFSRDSAACNADHTGLMDRSGRLKDQRSPVGSHPRCASPFGVRDLAGNLEEFVALDTRGPLTPAMKGAYWQPGRNHCRAKQTAHDRYYKGTETGFRCCAEARDPAGWTAL